MSEKRHIAALWAFDSTDRYPPQFVGAVSDGLRDALYEESERIRLLAEEWFTEFDDGGSDRWTFEVRYHDIEAPPSPSPAPPSGDSRTPCADGPCTLSSPGCAGPSLQEPEQ